MIVCASECACVKLIHKISSLVHNAVFNRANYSNYMNNFFSLHLHLLLILYFMRRLSNWITMSLSISSFLPLFHHSRSLIFLHRMFALFHFKCYKMMKNYNWTHQSIMIDSWSRNWNRFLGILFTSCTWCTMYNVYCCTGTSCLDYVIHYTQTHTKPSYEQKQK